MQVSKILFVKWIYLCVCLIKVLHYVSRIYKNHFDLSILLFFLNILIDVTWNEVNFDLPLCPFSVFM